MLFHSIEFILFFIVVLGVYYSIPHNKRWFLLLAASYIFYAWWKPTYAFLILFSTAVDYTVALRIDASNRQSFRKYWLWLSLMLNLGILATFKYLDFFLENITWLSEFSGASINFPKVDWVLPIGISFYTFQTLSYTIDVYRKKIKPEKHFGHLALYVSFFPQLVAGPIERAASLLPQLKKKISWDTVQAKYGILMIVWGFFKKLVIADRLAIYVDQVYANPALFDGGFSLVAAYAFAFQVYCDFSAYSDMAVGIAALLGVQLMHNFKQPFFSTSLLDFFSRWHISFMLWLRDYVYKPLNRFSTKHHLFNLFLVFLISGIWHGAAWTFIIWGAFNGLVIILGRGMRKQTWFRKIKNTFFSWLFTFHAYWLGTIVFRASDINDAYLLIKNIITGTYLQGSTYFTILDSTYEMMIAILALCFLLVVEYLHLKGLDFKKWARKGNIQYYVFFYLCLLSIITLGRFGGDAFIYFQF